MSDTNATAIHIGRSNARTFPLTTPDPLNLRALRTTGLPNLAFTPATVTSNEFRQDGQVTDIIRVGGEAGGDDNFELSYGAHDELMSASLFNVFVNTLEKSGATEVAAINASIIEVDQGGDFLENQILELSNNAGPSVGRGIYFLQLITGNNLTVNARDTDVTNEVTAAMSSVDADPANDVEATRLKVVGYRADADGEIALTVSGGVATLTATGGTDFTGIRGGADIAPGDAIKLANFPLATSNVYARVLTSSATEITFEAPFGMVDDSAGSTRAEIYFGDKLINGVDLVSAHEFAVELSFGDHSPITRKLLLGMAVNNFNVQINSQAIVTGTATFFGRVAKYSANENSATGNGELYDNGLVINRLSAPQFNIYNSSSNVGRFGRGASPIGSDGLNFVLDATIQMTRNLTRNNAVGFDGAASIGRGEVGVTGNLNAYFDSGVLAEQVIDGSDTSLDIVFRDLDGRAISYDMPRIKFTGGAPTIPAKNQQVTIPLQYQAIRSVDLGYTVAVTRFAYAA